VNGGASVCTHIGISSIPFREYVTTGVRQLIPAAPETGILWRRGCYELVLTHNNNSSGRVEWKDIWGRSWAQPVRSLFVDEAPIPPPLRNFIMTTTFELLDPSIERCKVNKHKPLTELDIQQTTLNNRDWCAAFPMELSRQRRCPCSSETSQQLPKVLRNYCMPK